MKYLTKLKRIITEKKSNLVIGLDTDINKIPDFLREKKNPEYEFNKKIIMITKDLVAGYKFNMAFYEAMDDRGFEVLEKSLKLIPDNCITICDAKRGDIVNTSELYARVYFDYLNFDAITISPYLGVETVSPFLTKKEKYVYVLALTTNPGSNDFQKLKISGKYLHEIITEKFIKKLGTGRIGFVFGANHYKEIQKITSKYRNLSILIPGIGAQGNDLSKLKGKIKSNAFIINMSRSVIYDDNLSVSEGDFSQLVLTRTIKSNAELNNNLHCFK